MKGCLCVCIMTNDLNIRNVCHSRGNTHLNSVSVFKDDMMLISYKSGLLLSTNKITSQ